MLPGSTWMKILILIMALVGIAFMAMLAVVNAFPAGMTIGLVAVLFGLLLITWLMLCRKSLPPRILGVLLSLVFLIIYGVGTYYLGSTYAAFNRMSNTGDEGAISSTGKNITTESFNVYITGIDQWESEKGLDLERSDVNMIVTVCPNTHKILLTSIPRDTYVPLHRTGDMDKLTHTGIYGVDETINTMEEWLGIDMDYYLKMNFTAVVDVINAIGGVDVYSPVEFVPVKRDWWTVKKGWNHMNGKQALAFARERKAFNSEDSKRVENQQRVVDAIIKKLTTSPAILTRYPDILAAASENMSTNMTNEEMQALVKMQLSDLGEWDVMTQKLIGSYEMDYVASLTQESTFLVYKADQDSKRQIVDTILSIMSPSIAEIEQYEKEREEARMEQSLKDFMSKITGRNSDSDAADDEGSDE